MAPDGTLGRAPVLAKIRIIPYFLIIPSAKHVKSMEEDPEVS